ncbi:MAG: hypothetical protein BMS9Abin34_145 [Patescibacteria group bacterium]|nr:MAG: hypothetical protein BMS9Abin34_145 [Patescibacteria group bacterium]
MGNFKITVRRTKNGEFEVTVGEDGGSRTVHRVVLDEGFAKKVGLHSEETVRKSFEFLLSKESKESILSSFSIPDTINNYFPDFEGYLSRN